MKTDNSEPRFPRRRLVWTGVLVLVGAMIVFGAVNRRALYRAIMIRKEVIPYEEPAAYWESHAPSRLGIDSGPTELPGRRVRLRNWWTEEVVGLIAYWRDSSVKRRVLRYENEAVVATTHWGSDGTVVLQKRAVGDDFESRTEPPWWDGATDQSVRAGEWVGPDGLFREYYEDTAVVRIEYPCVGGEVHGVTTEWWPDGRIRTQVRVDRGRAIESKVEPPWWEGAQPQRLHGRLVLVARPDELRRHFAFLEFWRIRDGGDDVEACIVFGDFVVLEFVDGRRAGDTLLYTGTTLTYSGRFAANEPVGVHTVWKIEPDGGRAIAWQRVYGEDQKFEDRTSSFLDPVEPTEPFDPEAIAGVAAVRELRPPTRNREGEPPVWVFAHSMARGGYVGGRRDGVWSFGPRTGEITLQRRYRDGALIERRGAPPWWSH